MEALRFALACFFIFSGLFVLGIATLGLFRLHTTLNRLHAAAKCDTLGSLLTLIGLAIIIGVNPIMFKLIALIAFLWISNPIAVYMISRAEILTNPNINEECEVIEL